MCVYIIYNYLRGNIYWARAPVTWTRLYE